MRLLDRYIARECLKIILLCLVVFMGVYVVVDLFEKFSRFLEAKVQPGLILRYYLFSLPNIFTQVLPVAVLLASLLSLGGMARHNEILAMKMGQVSTLRIALPCISVGLAASLAAWISRSARVSMRDWKSSFSRLRIFEISPSSAFAPRLVTTVPLCGIVLRMP